MYERASKQGIETRKKEQERFSSVDKEKKRKGIL